MQNEERENVQAEPDWPTCGAEDTPGCVGVQVGSHGRCWAHLSLEELRQALSSLGPGSDLDLRGTTFSDRLLRKILSAYTDPHSGALLIGHASLENSTFECEARFEGAEFNGDARFFDAKFNRKANFYGVKFKHYAGFNAAEFSYADFEKAEFTGNAISFKDVTFRDAAEFADTVFEGCVEFNRAKFMDNAYFQGTHSVHEATFADVKFSGTSSFQRGRFGGLTSFGGAAFAVDADFADAQFGDDTRFGYASFNGDAYFVSCKFFGQADFGETRFNGGVFFDRTNFKGDLSFAAAKVEADALFNSVDFGGDVAFDEVEVKGAMIVGPSTIGGELRLNDFLAMGTVEMTAAANQVNCQRAKFNAQVLLSLASGDLWLTDSEFASTAIIESSLRLSTGSKRGLTRVRVRSLRGTDAEHLTLTDVDLSRCVLSGLRRPEQLRLGGRCVFAPTPHGIYWRWKLLPWRWTAREALFEEHLWRASPAAPGPHVNWAPSEQGAGEDGAATPERLEVLYRQLRASLEAASNEPGAADFYYGEMEMRRRASRNRSERWILNGYWLVSGYGLRGSRALLSLAALILSAALVLQHTGFVGPVPGYLYCSLYTLGSVLSLTLAGSHLPTVLTAWGDLVRIVLRIGGPVLLGLAALAVRGRVKR